MKSLVTLRRPLALALAASLALTAVASTAGADPRWHKDRGYDDPRAYDDGTYSDGYDYARVVDVDPIVRQVRVEEPRRECWNETRYEDRGRSYPRSTAGSMILGGVIGAAIGNQIGRGDGRRAATVAGALIGSAIGHDAGDRRRDRYDAPPRPYSVEQCDVRVETRYEERIDGYDVTYEYNGRTLHTRLPYDPGKRIRVRVAVEPAER